MRGSGVGLIWIIHLFLHQWQDDVVGQRDWRNLGGMNV